MHRLKKIINSLATVITIILVIFSISLTLPRFLGLKPLDISSSLIYVDENTLSEDVESGDNIVYISSNDTLKVSKVDEIKKDANTFIVYDNNIVYFENYIGKASFKIPFMGYAVSFINTLIGKFITVISLLLLIGVIVMTTTKPDDNHK